MSDLLSSSHILDFRGGLLAWYYEHRRRFPWRGEIDPYRIWVSEVMLQQTRAEQCVDRYIEFLRQFPDVHAIASADQDDVLKAWEGMGYYARARNLHAAARVIVAEYGARLPRTAAGLRTLPGFGPYISAAVGSIAFQDPVAVVDGNVRRVMARLFGFTDPVGSRALDAAVEEAATKLLDAETPGDFNQAVMELGATVCTPRKPQCPCCPLAEMCTAGQGRGAERWPVKRAKSARPHRLAVAALVWREGRVLVAKRPPRGLLGGLWELPGGFCENAAPLQETLEASLRERFGLRVHVLRSGVEPVRHVFTHFSMDLHGFVCEATSDVDEVSWYTDSWWVDPSELERMAWPRAHRRLWERLINDGVSEHA